jgi:hypothetical protein
MNIAEITLTLILTLTQFLYRAIFNLLPSFIETICVIVMMVQRAGSVVGLTGRGYRLGLGKGLGSVVGLTDRG